MSSIETLDAFSQQGRALVFRRRVVALTHRWPGLADVFDFPGPLGPGVQPLRDHVGRQRILLQFPAHHEVIAKNRLLEVGELLVAGQLHRDVLGGLALVADPCVAELADQLVEVRPGLHAPLDHLAHEVRLELAILSAEVVTLVAGEHAGCVLRIRPDALAGRHQLVLLVDVLLKGLEVIDVTVVVIDRIHFLPGEQILAWYDDMDMWLAILQFPRLAVGYL
nr:hypothetical protein [Pseudomonas sp. Q1-7]